MQFGQRLRDGRFPVALEITPPQRRLPGVLLRRARLLGDAACAVNVIQRPGRQSSLDACLDLRAAGVEPVWHLVTRDRDRESLLADVRRARDGGVEQVLCIRGDGEGARSGGGVWVREAVALVRDELPGATIGATLNQYAPDWGAALRNLEGKLNAGASYVQTQPVFDLDDARDAISAVRERWPGTHVVAMVMPLVETGAADRIEARLGIRLPGALRARIRAGAGPAWEAFEATVAGLAEGPLVDGVAVMTFEMDPPAETGRRIVVALTAAGAVAR